MGKKSTKRALLNQKWARPGALALVGLVVAGGAYAATAGDLIYGSKSLLAAAVGMVDQTPRIVITRSSYSPSSSVWPADNRTLGVFDVSGKYINSYGYLTTITTNVTSDAGRVGLPASALLFDRIVVSYESCSGDVCSQQEVPTSYVNKTVQSDGRLTYTVMSKPGRYAVVGDRPARIYVRAYPAYQTAAHKDGAAIASVKADIDTATGGARTCLTSGGVTNCTTKGVRVNTSLAYGSWLPVLRGVGYGYGYFDYDNNGKFVSSDADYLLRVATGVLACPVFKICDVNKSGTVTAADAQQILKMTGPVVQKDVRVDVAFVSADTAAVAGDNANDDRVTFKIKYKVTAVNGDVYLPAKVAVVPAAGSLVGNAVISVDRNGTLASPSGISATLENTSDSTLTPSGNYLIKSGQTEFFVVTALVQLPAAGSAGAYRMMLAGLWWDVTDKAAPGKDLVNDLSTFRTSYVTLN